MKGWHGSRGVEPSAKAVRRCGWIAAALIAASVAAQAHQGVRVFPIYELPPSLLPDLHDGSIEDWEDAVPGPSIDYLDLAPVEARGVSTSRDQSDLTFRCFLGWSNAEQRLYLAIERIDDVYVNTYPVPEGDEGVYLSMRWHDGVEFMVDGDHSGGQYYYDYFYDFPSPNSALSVDEMKYLTGREAQEYVALAESPPGELQIVTTNAGNAWVTRPPYLDIGGIQLGESPNYSLVEVAVTPWDALDWHGPASSTPSRLEPGIVIGFQMSIPDIDTAPGAENVEEFFTLDGLGWNFLSADYFVDAQLFPCDLSGCSRQDGVSAVAPDSWGRIKAGFR